MPNMARAAVLLVLVIAIFSFLGAEAFAEESPACSNACSSTYGAGIDGECISGQSFASGRQLYKPPSGQTVCTNNAAPNCYCNIGIDKSIACDRFCKVNEYAGGACTPVGR